MTPKRPTREELERAKPTAGMYCVHLGCIVIATEKSRSWGRLGGENGFLLCPKHTRRIAATRKKGRK